MANDLTTEAGRAAARGGKDPQSGYFSNGQFVTYTNSGGNDKNNNDKNNNDTNNNGYNEQDILNAFKEGSGFSIKDLEEKKRQFDAQLQFSRDQMEQIGIPELVIKQQLAKLEQDKFAELTQQAHAAQAFDYLKFASTLSGPADYFQQADFFRGAQGQQQLPVFLQALQKNVQMPAFTGTGDTAPATLTPQTLATNLAGANGTTGTASVDPRLAAIGQIAANGAQKLAPGSLEQLTPDELSLFGSGLQKVGISAPAFLQQYAKSRPQQTATNLTSLAA